MATRYSYGNYLRTAAQKGKRAMAKATTDREIRAGREADEVDAGRDPPAEPSVEVFGASNRRVEPTTRLRRAARSPARPRRAGRSKSAWPSGSPPERRTDRALTYRPGPPRASWRILAGLRPQAATQSIIRTQRMWPLRAGSRLHAVSHNYLNESDGVTPDRDQCIVFSTLSYGEIVEINVQRTQIDLVPFARPEIVITSRPNPSALNTNRSAPHPRSGCHYQSRQKASHFPPHRSARHYLPPRRASRRLHSRSAYVPSQAREIVVSFCAIQLVIFCAADGGQRRVDINGDLRRHAGISGEVSVVRPNVQCQRTMHVGVSNQGCGIDCRIVRVW